MKNKKLTAIVLAVLMLFTCMVPAYAAGEAQIAAETEQTQSFSIVEGIKEFIHRIIEKVLLLFGMECPFCKVDYVPAYVEETVAKYNDGVNAIKNYDGKVTVKETADVSVKISDVPSVAASVINEIAESFTGTTKNTWIFNKGKNSDGIAISDKIEPCGRNAELDAVGVITTESAQLDNGGSKIRIVLMPEKSIYDGTSVTQEAVYNAGAITTLNPGALDLGPIVIQNAETTYRETVLEAEYDSLGRIVKLEISVSMDISAVAKAAVSISTVIGIDAVYEYTFDYWS